MTVIDDLPWSEVERLISTYGGESHIADRIKVWRKANGWTLQELGDRVHLGAPAIHKIENPAGAGGRRRNLSVKEALDFAKAFDKPLAEILLPDVALEELDGWSRFQAAVEALNEARHQWSVYRNEIEAAQAAAARNPRFAQRLEAYLAVAEQQRRDEIVPIYVNDADTEDERRVRAKLVKQDPARLPLGVEDEYPTTSAIAGARAALSSAQIPWSLLEGVAG